jgi:DNA polymerase III delta subunit
MITILVGKRTPEFEKKRNSILASFQKTNSIEKREARELVSTFDEIQTASLFGDKKLFILNGVLDDEETQKVLLEKVESLASAPHDVLITTEKLLAAETKKLGPCAEIITITEKISKIPSFDPFALASAFASGDKKKTWIMFQQVAHVSDEMEPTHGMIWWKLKDMMIKKNSVFNQDQLNEMVRKLVSVYHESRLGGLGMRERLEEFFLSIKK